MTDIEAATKIFRILQRLQDGDFTPEFGGALIERILWDRKPWIVRFFIRVGRAIFGQRESA